MTVTVRRLLTWLAILVIVGFGIHFLADFEWAETGRAMLGTRLLFLLAAALVGLLSPVCKATALYVILRSLKPVRWSTTQGATFVGTALTIISGAVVGEAARARVLVARDGVSWTEGITSILYLRLIEGLGLAVFLVVGPVFFPVPEPIRVAQGVAAGVLLAAAVLVRLRWWGVVTAHAPARLRKAAHVIGEMGSLRNLPTLALLAVANWTAQWITYDLALRAVGLPVGHAAAFVSLIATNVVGAVQLPAGNLGVFQASMVVALAPFGVSAEHGVAAGIVLQAALTLPILAIALGLFGVAGVARLRSVGDNGQ